MLLFYRLSGLMVVKHCFFCPVSRNPFFFVSLSSFSFAPCFDFCWLVSSCVFCYLRGFLIINWVGIVLCYYDKLCIDVSAMYPRLVLEFNVLCANWPDV